MTTLSEYLSDIVEPTFDDFRRNQNSLRHAYLACVATYHAIDRATYPRKVGNLRTHWGRKSFQFKIVDMIAHHFKHVRSGDEKEPPPVHGIPLTHLVFGSGRLNSQPPNAHAVNDSGIDLHNLYFVVRDAIQFIHQQDGLTES